MTAVRDRAGRLARLLIPAAALLVLLSFGYHEAPKNGFHLDDIVNIHEVGSIRITELSLDNLLQAARDAYLPRRPLPSMTFAFDWWRGGGQPAAFQWTNLVIHGAASLSVLGLLALVLRRTGRSPWVVAGAAFFGAAVWACHPIQVQAVSYVVQRMASMAALFTILSVILYILGRETRSPIQRWVLFALGALSFMLGLVSKETAAITPFLVLLAEYGVVRHGRPLIRRQLDWILLALPVVAAAFIAIDVISGSGPLAKSILSGYERRDFTLAERLLTEPRVIAFHFSQIFWPLPTRFALEHEFQISTGLLSPPSTLAALAGVIAWCAAGVAALFRARWRIVGFFVLWVPATLVIESTVIPLELLFEHRMYMPSVGLAGLLALATGWLFQHFPKFRPLVAAGLATAVVLVTISTYERVPVWRTVLTLSQDSVKHAPNSSRAWANVAVGYINEGRWAEAEAPLRKALEINPYEHWALVYLATIALDRGNIDEAGELADRLVELKTGEPRALNLIGEVRLAQNEVHTAIRIFRHVVSLSPRDPPPRWNLALAYERAGLCAKAREHWLAYLDIEPNAHDRERVRKHLQEKANTDGFSCFAH